MKLLLLGGTKFLGKHIAAAALGAGHDVTLFTRGETNPALFPDAEHLRGDRDGDLAALERREWDVAVDTSGYVPRVVGASAGLLSHTVARYVFISSISVYADFAAPRDERSPVAELAEPTEDYRSTAYGALKALCEAEVERAFPGRALLVRPGLIVGPTTRPTASRTGRSARGATARSSRRRHLSSRFSSSTSATSRGGSCRWQRCTRPASSTRRAVPVK